LAAPQRDERGAENVDAAAAELKVEQKPEELRLSPVTFDAIWEQRRRDAQAVQTMPSE
jgi:hypothetical protein